MKFRLNLDTERLQEKPRIFDGRLRNRLCNAASIAEITPEELGAAVEQGRSFTPAVLTGTTADTWQSQQVICADIDNDTGEDTAIEDKPASWGNHSEYRLLTNGSDNFFTVKAATINTLP